MSLSNDVPYDVWRHITSFLPPAEVEKLYTLNPSLLSIALDERYKAAGFGLLFQKQTMKSLARLVEPEVACRVKMFTCRPGHLCNLLQLEKQGKWPHGKRMAENVPARFQPISPTGRPEVDRIQALNPKTIQQIVLSIMRNLTSLTCLNIDIPAEDHIPFSQAIPSFFVEGWQVFGQNLTALNLSVPLEDLHLVLPTGPTKLTNLRTLSVRVFRASAVDETVIVPKALLLFINSHKTIASLALEAPEGINLFFLLRHITLMPSLRSFKLKQPFVSLVGTDFSALYQFLHTHQTRIRDLNIELTSRYRRYYPDSGIFFSQKCFRVPIPVIERLSVNLSYLPPVYATGLVSVVVQYKATLTSLRIKEQSFTDDVLSSLITHLAFPGILRELEISIVSLKPSVFHRLATNLPRLQVLTLDFLSVVPDVYDNAGGPKNRFAEEMYQISIPQWKLHTLNLGCLDAHSSVRQHRKAAILDLLPNVQTLSGLSRVQYLTNEDI